MEPSIISELGLLVQVKIYPEIGDAYFILIPCPDSVLTDKIPIEEYVEEWLKDHVKNVQSYEIEKE